MLPLLTSMSTLSVDTDVEFDDLRRPVAADREPVHGARLISILPSDFLPCSSTLSVYSPGAVEPAMRCARDPLSRSRRARRCAPDAYLDVTDARLEHAVPRATRQAARRLAA